jgi:hypothetical protein
VGAGEPGLGIRISLEHVENECNGALGPREFASSGSASATGRTRARRGPRHHREQWAACAERDESNRITGLPTFAVDVNPDRTWGAIGVGGFREDGGRRSRWSSTSAAPTGSSRAASS